ncbi:type II toxin-antitoxin system RelE/ParE family toxin [Streptomyces sp. 4503]|uniref:Type II toxin-antitoxin system RelE/ParE family toxin n=1 Tax=Streptomyces niphimycinicus TaxID=2842201 RepID=A0ABS6C8Q9_9ACTN|nr:type II toxin-antitoxin system RelE/ParE family toxin [Streptomyces niphimycinicus]MBU3863273.1 type II toxin-antitoxin system RelE/ParE family toxin [Streptomyces niphimycinicus]
MNDALYVIEVEPEVRAWLELLPGRLYRKVEAYAELLAELGPQTPMPYARRLREGVAELRPSLDGIQTRVTYWITNDRRVVLLTVFHKTRAHEEAQINRAVLAKKECEAEHGPAHTDFTRGKGEQ